jgi:hypothetical protein
MPTRESVRRQLNDVLITKVVNGGLQQSPEKGWAHATPQYLDRPIPREMKLGHENSEQL